MISNATPLICLAKIKQLELLKKVFGTVTIPQAVKDEVFLKEKPGYAALQEAFTKKWIKGEVVTQCLHIGLGKGEREAITLARERKEPILLDDAAAIRAAETFNIEVIRTTGVLFLAVKKKIISRKETRMYLQQLVENGYYITPRVYVVLLERLQ
jgi:uncharacterized protein